jgi:CBS domain-containing protein
MRALEIMTSPVITTSPKMSVQAVAKLLANNRISGVPVVDDATGQILGIISEGDLMRRVETGTGSERRSWWLDCLAGTRELASIYVKEHGRTVRDVMSEHVISIARDTPLKEIADILVRNRIKRVPVLEEGKLVGIVSRADLIRALASVPAPEEAVTSGDDSDVRDAVVHELRQYRWALPKSNVQVTDGIVHLWGIIESEEEGQAIRVVVERVPGVKAVESHLSFPMFVPPV